jgi:uncharacterized protein (DUF433 family)
MIEFRDTIDATEGNMWFEKHIERVPGVQGGEPVIVGTRTPVRTIAVLFHVTYPGDRSEVERALPHLTREQIDAGLAYYDHNRDEIDGYIDEHHRAFESLVASQ